MTVRELYKKTAEALKNGNVENADFEAATIVQKLLNVDRSAFLMYQNDEAKEEVCNKTAEAVEKRLNGEPLQYIIGEWDFYDITFEVGRGVLIPRPETEELCDYVISQIKNKDKPVVFDLCSGSGCIGLSIKHRLPNADVYLVEYSDEALHYLNRNREKLGFARNTVSIKGDVLGGFEKFGFLPKPDVVVSNPPYIKTADLASLQKEVKQEPEMALDGGDDGLIFYRCFAEKWLDYVNDGGFFAVECGEDQAFRIASLFEKHCDEIKILKDFNNIDRFVAARKGGRKDNT